MMEEMEDHVDMNYYLGDFGVNLLKIVNEVQEWEEYLKKGDSYHLKKKWEYEEEAKDIC